MIPVIEGVLGCRLVNARIILTIVAAAGVAAAAGCGSRAETTGSGSRKIVASFYPLAYVAQEIGGASVTVENLTPAGAEPHDLELTSGDVRDVKDADLVLFLGNGFQPAIERAVAGRKGRSLDLLAGQETRSGIGEEGRTAVDPHVWLDPVRYEGMARRIARALGDLSAADSFVAKLRALERAYRNGLAHCDRRQIVTSHAAFGYLAARYGLQQVPLEGLSPEAEPSPLAVQRLVEEVRATHATTVFFETLVSPKLAQTVAREAGVRTAVLDPLEGLTADEKKHGATYFTVMRGNLATLRTALSCR